MQFIKNSFGVKVFLLCWILVLLVPNWRQYALWQWDRDQLNPYLARVWPAFGSSAEQLKNSDDWRLRLESIEPYYVTVPQEIQGQGAKNRAKAIKEMVEKSDQYIAQYSELSKAFPQENAIRQAWILKGTVGGLRVESSPPKEANSFEKRVPYSKATLEALVQCTIDGEKIDPQNSFFPLMRAVFLFTLRRDNEAISAIHQAANCEFFDDGTRETILRRIELRSRVQHMYWFSKNMEVWSILFTHISPIYAAGRQTMIIAKQKQDGGDKIGALQLAYDLQRVGETFMNGKQFSIMAISGRGLTYYAWRRTIQNAGLVKHKDDYYYYPRTPEDRAETSRLFVQYARDSGQNKIADSALKAVDAFKKTDNYQQNSPAFAQLERDSLFLSGCFWLQAKLLKLTVIGGICWLISLIFTRKLEFRTLVQRKILFFTATFCAGATGVFFAIGIYFYGMGWSGFAGYYSDEREALNSLSPVFDNVLTTTLSTIWLTPIALLTTIQLASLIAPRIKSTKEFQLKNVMAGALYAIIVASLIGIIQANNDISGTSISLALWPKQVYVFFLAVFGATIFHSVNSTGRERISALLFWCSIWMLAAFCYCFSLQNVLITSICFATSVVLLILSVWIRGWKTSVIIPNLFPDFMFRIRIFAAVLGVFASIGYLGCSLATIIPETRMNTTLARQLEIGEVAWVEEQS